MLILNELEGNITPAQVWRIAGLGILLEQELVGTPGPRVRQIPSKEKAAAGEVSRMPADLQLGFFLCDCAGRGKLAAL